MIAITGASGQLGRLVIDELLKTVPASELVAAVRNPDKVADLAQKDVQIRLADYTQPDSLDAAFVGADKVLMISASDVGQRVSQHTNVIAAVTKANVDLLVYTSILHADTTPLPLGDEHKETERLLAESGIPHALLRNGWYTENYAMGIPAALQYGVVLGCAGDGQISSAARIDYAVAAATVLLADDQAGKVYELAGDEAYTLSEFAAEIAKQSGKEIRYQNMPEAEYEAALKGAGLPDGLARLLAESDTGASQGGLFDDSKTLSSLIGRSTTPMADVVKLALAD